jgi:acyl-CoA thioester hydrolase
VAEPFAMTLRVRYVECDMQRHVFNGHYLTWFDLAHTEALRAATKLSYMELTERHGMQFVVAESNVRYRAPAHYDDELTIRVAFEPPTTSSLTSRFTILRDGATIAEGFLRHVCVDAQTYNKMPWPDALREAFGRFQTAAGAPPSPPA